MDIDAKTAVFMVGRETDGGFQIMIGNYIVNESVAKLRNKIDHINSLSPEELRTQYQEQLATTKLSEKGGAGLGFIDMARRSGQKLEYSFHPVSEQLSFFSLAVSIH